MSELQKILNVVDEFIEWYWQYWNLTNNIDEETVHDTYEHLNNTYKIDIIKKYKIIYLITENHDKLYLNDYLVAQIKVAGWKCINYCISNTMTHLHREITYNQIKLNILNILSKEEIERRRNKIYALNILYYIYKLPYDVLSFKINKMI